MQHSDSGGPQVDSDELLVRRTAGGDREAFAALYRRHHGSVYRFARLMTGSPRRRPRTLSRRCFSC